MPSPSLLDVLDAAGMRVTRPRRQVAELIGTRSAPFTAAELLEHVDRRGLRIGRATIFRALEVFARLGVIERLDLPDGEHAYVVCRPETTTHHHHIVCATCGRSTAIVGCNIAGLAADVADRTGYRVDTHRIELFGTCPTCQAQTVTQ
ncbi:MAG: Fur family transcriptional regulator [Candidatus Limnocylindria bacterium]